jgi:hypothetical protein
MAKNRIQDLRDHLFATLESLRDEEKPMDVERAKAVCLVSEQIIDSAKVEVHFMEVNAEATGTGFFDKPLNQRTLAERADGAIRELNTLGDGRRAS